MGYTITDELFADLCAYFILDRQDDADLEWRIRAELEEKVGRINRRIDYAHSLENRKKGTD